MPAQRNRKDVAESKGIRSIISEGTEIQGTVNVKEGIRIDGFLNGRLSVAETLVVGKTGRLEADVTTRNAVIGGEVLGNVTAAEYVLLEAESVLVGDLKVKSLAIEEGATFHGNCNMRDTKSLQDMLDARSQEKGDRTGEGESTQQE